MRPAAQSLPPGNLSRYLVGADLAKAIREGLEDCVEQEACKPEHAIKCIQTAETFPPGAQREKFFDMAKQWTDLAINIEGSEALADPSSPPERPGERYRFGSRCEGPIGKKAV